MIPPEVAPIRGISGGFDWIEFMLRGLVIIFLILALIASIVATLGMLLVTLFGLGLCGSPDAGDCVSAIEMPANIVLSLCYTSIGLSAVLVLIFLLTRKRSQAG